MCSISQAIHARQCYCNGPFCRSLLYRCWLDYLAYKNRHQNDLLCVGWDVAPFSLLSVVIFLYPISSPQTYVWLCPLPGLPSILRAPFYLQCRAIITELYQVLCLFPHLFPVIFSTVLLMSTF